MRLRAAAALLLGLGAGTGLLACGGSGDQPPPAAAGAITAGSLIGKGSIAGRVLFRGTPPARHPIAMSGEASCHKPDGGALSEDLIVNPDGTLRNVYVHVVSGLGSRVFAPPAPPAEVDQKGCLFVPHLLAVQTNQVILFRNSDPAVHNVHARATQNVAFNVSMSGQGRTARRYFAKPEVVPIRCDIHAWMAGFIAVGDNPFQAVTGDGGSFSLDGLPAGEYQIEAWHEKLGTARQNVTLADGERRDLSFTLGP